MSVTTQPTTGAEVGAKPATKPQTFEKDDLPLSYREQVDLTKPVADLDDEEFENLHDEVHLEYLNRAPESRGERLFQELLREQDALVRKQVSLAKDAVRLISGALTSFVDRRDPQARIRQDDAPIVNYSRERVEMTTIVSARWFVRGKYTVWAEVGMEEDARCGVVIRRRWRDPVHITANDFPALLEQLAWTFSLAAKK